MQVFKMWWSFFKGLRERTFTDASVANALLNQILIFPLVVVLVVALTLLCGGRCAIWQWWVAVAVVLAVPWLCCRWKKASIAGALFLVFLMAIWVVSGISVTRLGVDCHLYHFPIIRMLMLGWNPVWESTYDAIQTASGEVDGCNAWFVLSMSRPVWYFTAVATFFTRNHFDCYHPIVLFSVAGTLGYVWKLIGKTNVLVRLCSVVFVASYSLFYTYAPDMVATLSALGLLFCLYGYLNDRIWRPLPMLCFSFWLCSSKHTGILFSAVIWMSFAAVVLIRERREWKPVFMRLLKMAAMLGTLFLVANFSPYITNWLNYSHPLYPQCTMDEEKFPSMDLSADFNANVNEDARTMLNRPAAFVNAYISSDLVRGYYAWKLNKPDFRPWSRTWGINIYYCRSLGDILVCPWSRCRANTGDQDGWDTPLPVGYRCLIVIPIMLLLLFGRLSEKFVAAAMLLCAFALPAGMIGFLRYVAVIRYSFVFCLPMIWRIVSGRWAAKCIFVGALMWICLGRFYDAVKAELVLIDDRVTIFECFDHGLPDTLHYFKTVQDGKPLRGTSSCLKLLKALLPRLQRAEIKDIETVDPGEGGKAPVCDGFPGGSFRLPAWYDIRRRSALWRIRTAAPEPRGGDVARFFCDFRSFCRAFAADVPKAVRLRLTGRIDNHMLEPESGPPLLDGKVEPSIGVLDRWCVSVTAGSVPGGEAIAGTSDVVLSFPARMHKNNVRGIQIDGVGTEGNCTLNFPAGGEVVIDLSRPKYSNDECRFSPFISDYSSVVINGREMIDGPVSVAYNRSHAIRFQVGEGETLNISFRLKHHKYTVAELRRLLISASRCTRVTGESVDGVLADAKMAEYIAANPNGDAADLKNQGE